jgi:hypothetical protein
MAVGSTMLTIPIVAPKLRRLGLGDAAVVGEAPASYAASHNEH